MANGYKLCRPFSFGYFTNLFLKHVNRLLSMHFRKSRNRENLPKQSNIHAVQIQSRKSYSSLLLKTLKNFLLNYFLNFLKYLKKFCTTVNSINLRVCFWRKKLPIRAHQSFGDNLQLAGHHQDVQHKHEKKLNKISFGGLLSFKLIFSRLSFNSLILVKSWTTKQFIWSKFFQR